MLKLRLMMFVTAWLPPPWIGVGDLLDGVAAASRIWRGLLSWRGRRVRSASRVHVLRDCGRTVGWMDVGTARLRSPDSQDVRGPLTLAISSTRSDFMAGRSLARVALRFGAVFCP